MKQRISAFFKSRPTLSFGETIVIFILIEGLFSFCSQKTCPAFSDAAFENWFPYKENQTLYFTSATGKKDTFAITGVSRSEEYKTYRQCAMTATISAYRNLPASSYFYINLTKYNETNTLSITLNDFYLGNATLSDQQITPRDSSFNSTALSNISINGKTFANVTQLQRDTSVFKSFGIYKVWLAKGAGLVGYEYYPSREQWAKD